MQLSFSTQVLPRILPVMLCMLLASCTAALHHREGMKALDAGNYAQAIKELKLATELEPRDVDYRKAWLQNRETVTARLLAGAESAFAAGQYAEAGKQYQAILSYDRENSRARAGMESITRAQRAASEAKDAQEAL